MLLIYNTIFKLRLINFAYFFETPSISVKQCQILLAL